jgi:hypothetical protein
MDGLGPGRVVVYDGGPPVCPQVPGAHLGDGTGFDARWGQRAEQARRYVWLGVWH